MSDLIEKQEHQRYTFGNDKFNLEDAYHDCKLVFDGITDDDSFQKADTGLILYYANEIIYALQKALEGSGANALGNDCISRQAAIDALEVRKDKTAKGEIGGFYNTIIQHDIDAIKQLPSAQPEIVHCKDCEWWTKQDKSLQGRCELMQMYPTGEWFCGNAQKRVSEDE